MIHRGRSWPFVLAAVAACNGDSATDLQVATSIELSAASVSFAHLGETQQVTAIVRDRAGAAMPGAPLTWSSSFPDRVSVSTTGLLTAQSTGSAVISARSGAAVETLPVSVSQAPATLVLSPSRIDLQGPGDTMTVVPSVYDAGGHPIANATVTWSSNDENVVTVDGAGLVVAVSTGSAAITGQISGSALARSVGAEVAGGVMTGPTGGRVSAGDGRVTLQIPPAALSGPLFITAGPAQGLPTGVAPIAGTAFELEPDGLTFLQPVTLTISYDAGAVPPGIPESELRLHKVVRSSYEEVEGSSADPDANLVSGTIGGFSIYAVLRALRITTSTLPDGSVGFPYTAPALGVSSGADDGVWSVASGSLPGGLSLSQAGVLSGVPTAAGAFPFTVQVESDGQRTLRSLTLIVHHPPFAVTDLTVLERSSTALKIRFTEVDDGTGMASDYAIRHAISPIDWESAAESEVIVEGTQAGATRQVTIDIPVGAKTSHDVQMVAFRGTPGVDALFSGLSGIATAPVLAPTGLCRESPAFAVATFADVAVEAKVRSARSLTPDDPITCAVAASVTQLAFGTLDPFMPRDLTGIQNLTGLQSLIVNYGGIHDLSPLASLTSLTNLGFYRALGGTSIDLSPLSGLVNLTRVSFHDAQPVKDIGPLASLGNLEWVHLENTGVRDLSPLADLPRLTELHVRTNPIPDITRLGDFAHLTRLTLSGTGRVNDLEPLAQLTGLEWLEITGNPGLTDVGPLAQLTGLEWLGIGGNQALADMGPLLANPGLGQGDRVFLRSTSVSCADVAALEAKGPSVDHNCLSINTTSLPDGEVAVPYAAKLTASVFLPVWSLASGSAPLPPGLSLSAAGDISGTPVQTGSWTFTVEVRDPPPSGYTRSARHTLSITINQPPLNLEIAGVHLNQGNQSPEGLVGGVANRPGLLRVILRSDRLNGASPAVRVRIFRDGVLVREALLPSPRTGVPMQPSLDDPGQTWNLQLTASEIVPGLSVDALVDPGNAVPETDEADNAYPPGGGTAPLEVESLPPLRVVFIPIESTVHGSLGVVNAGNTDQLLSFVWKWLPVSDFGVAIHAPMTSNHDLGTDAGWGSLLADVQALRTLEGATDQYYHGIIGQVASPRWGGLGYVPFSPASDFRSAISLGSALSTVAHELGHNLGRWHAPCGNPAGPDLRYPYANAVIGFPGYDIVQGTLQPSSRFDYMSYCGPQWTSDYTFGAIREWRLDDPFAAPAPLLAASRNSVDGLLIWGRISSSGVSLNPAVTSQARPVLPTSPGENTLRGVAANGSELFSFTFDGELVADSEDPTERHFAFFVPLAPEAIDQLVEITVATPVGSASVGSGAGPNPAGALGPVQTLSLDQVGPGLVQVQWDATQYPLVVIRDRTTGEVLGIAREGTARVRAASTQDLLIVASDGTRTRALN